MIPTTRNLLPSAGIPANTPPPQRQSSRTGLYPPNQDSSNETIINSENTNVNLSASEESNAVTQNRDFSNQNEASSSSESPAVFDLDEPGRARFSLGFPFPTRRTSGDEATSSIHTTEAQMFRGLPPAQETGEPSAPTLDSSAEANLEATETDSLQAHPISAYSTSGPSSVSAEALSRTVSSSGSNTLATLPEDDTRARLVSVNLNVEEERQTRPVSFTLNVEPQPRASRSDLAPIPEASPSSAGEEIPPASIPQASPSSAGEEIPPASISVPENAFQVGNQGTETRGSIGDQGMQAAAYSSSTTLPSIGETIPAPEELPFSVVAGDSFENSGQAAALVGQSGALASSFSLPSGNDANPGPSLQSNFTNAQEASTSLNNDNSTGLALLTHQLESTSSQNRPSSEIQPIPEVPLDNAPPIPQVLVENPGAQIPPAHNGQNALIIFRNAAPAQNMNENIGQPPEIPTEPGAEPGMEHFDDNPPRNPTQTDTFHPFRPDLPDDSDPPLTPLRSMIASLSWGVHKNCNNWRVSISPTIQTALNRLTSPQVFINFKFEPSAHGFSVKSKNGFGTQWETKLQCCKWHISLEKGETQGSPYLEAGIQYNINDFKKRLHLDGLGIPSRLGGGIKTNGDFSLKFDAIFGTIATRPVHKFNILNIQGKMNFFPSFSLSHGPFSVDPLEVLRPIHHSSSAQDVQLHYVRLLNAIQQNTEKQTMTHDAVQKVMATLNTNSQKIDEIQILNSDDFQTLSENQVIGDSNVKKLVAASEALMKDGINEHFNTLTHTLNERFNTLNTHTNNLTHNVDRVFEQGLKTQQSASNIKHSLLSTLLAHHHEDTQTSSELLQTVQTQGRKQDECCDHLQSSLDNLNDQIKRKKWAPAPALIHSSFAVLLLKKVFPFLAKSTTCAVVVLGCSVVSGIASHQFQLAIKYEKSKINPSSSKILLLSFFQIGFVAGSTVILGSMMANFACNIVTKKPLYTTTFPFLAENSKMQLWLRSRVDKLDLNSVTTSFNNGYVGSVTSLVGYTTLIVFNLLPFVTISVSYIKTRSLTFTISVLFWYYIGVMQYTAVRHILETENCPSLVLPTRLENVKQVGKVLFISSKAGLHVLNPLNIFKSTISKGALMADLYKKNFR